MKTTYTNKHNLGPSLVAWLLKSNYSNVRPEGFTKELISVTSLMKPVRQQILSRQVQEVEIDVVDILAANLGQAVHTAIEEANTNQSKSEIKRICELTNLTPETFTLPILEQRYFKEFGPFCISGQLDCVQDGQYIDFKTTSVYSLLGATKDEDYILQGSLYRWLTPETITQDVMKIAFIFKDWSKAKASLSENYPQSPVLEKEYTLLSIEETENWITERIEAIKANAPLAETQEDLVQCSDKELWRTPPKYKYYSNSEAYYAGKRAQKVFDSFSEAETFKNQKGKGEVFVMQSLPRACNYCNAQAICQQYFDMFN